MDFSEQWKSLWPISSVFPAPLLIRAGDNNNKGGDGGGRDRGGVSSSSETSTYEIGPLIFNPCPETLTVLFTSPCLSPQLPPPFPNLSLPRFLVTTTDHTSSSTTTSTILPSTSSSIASEFGPQLSPPGAHLFCNRLHLLRCSGTHLVFAFFPTGTNSDRVGFLLLSVKESGVINVTARKGGGGEVFTDKNTLNHQILLMAVSTPFDSYPSTVSLGSSCFTTVGYLLACTTYSIHWYSAKIKGVDLGLESPALEYLGSKLFKTCAVVHACWSPHIAEENVVLLESGELFLFDLDTCSSRTWSATTRIPGKKLGVQWNNSTISKKGQWFSCEFSWHPRILIVAHSSAVFLVDLRSEGCNVSCLLKTEELFAGNSIQNDRFVALSRAGSDGFHYTVASTQLLLLCDVRKPFMPSLQWAHGLNNPHYITVFSLSELRSHSKDNKYRWASETGNCILLGSFWNCEFSLFCHGPDTRRSAISDAPKICKSFYAWEFPSELSLSARDCHCGSCLVREEFSKDALLEWIDWRQKKEIVFGFGILNQDFSPELSEQENFGGFTLIRIMSSGKLESQRYCASSEYVNVSERAHKESALDYEDSLLYAATHDDYRLPKIFQYLKLDFLYGYMNNKLAKTLVRKQKISHEGSPEIYPLNSDFHDSICQKLHACGVSREKASATIYDVFQSVSLPTSIHEIASIYSWSSLPLDLLHLAFSTYSEFRSLVNQKTIPLEFLTVPDQPHLPPFSFRGSSYRSNKWSQKLQPGNGVVGPLVPLPFLVTLRKIQKEDSNGLSADEELEAECNKVVQVASEIAMPSGSEFPNDHVVSLADDKEETCYGPQKSKPFSLYKPVGGFMGEYPTGETSIVGCESYAPIVHRTHKEERVNSKAYSDGLGLFDAHCPSEFKFNDHDPAVVFGPKELSRYKLLMRQNSIFLESLNCMRKE